MINLIVPIYNEAPFLKRCFDSIAAQMADDINVLLIDDASTDGSTDIARERAAQEGWAFYGSNKNQGVSRSRNCGLTAIVHGAKIPGDSWVTFLDSDDELVPDAFQIMREAIQNCPHESWFQFNHLRHYAKINKTVKKYDNRDGRYGIADLQNTHCWWGIWNKLIRIDAIRHSFRDDLRYGEDGIFVLEHLLDGQKIRTIDKETVVHHFENANSLTKSKTKDQLEALGKAQRELLRDHSGPDEPWENIRAIVACIDDCLANPIYKEILGGKK